MALNIKIIIAIVIYVTLLASILGCVGKLTSILFEKSENELAPIGIDNKITLGFYKYSIIAFWITLAPMGLYALVLLIKSVNNKV